MDTTVAETPTRFAGSGDVVLFLRLQRDAGRWREYGRPAVACGAMTWRMRNLTGGWQAGPASPGGNRFAANYFHIIAEIAPAVAAYRIDPAFRAGARLCAPGAAGEFLRQALCLAGINVPEVVAVAPATPRTERGALAACCWLVGGRGCRGAAADRNPGDIHAKLARAVARA